MMLAGSRSYYDEYIRKKGTARTLNDPPSLLTDRGAYMNFLEVQLERVSAACLSVNAYEERFTDMQSLIVNLEQKSQTTNKLVALNQSCLEELKLSADKAHFELKRYVETDLSSLRYKIEQLTSKQTEFENVITSTFRENKQSIHEISIELQTLKSQNEQNQNILLQCSQDIENIQNKLNNNIDLDLNTIKTVQSKMSFDIIENQANHTKTMFNLENKIQDMKNEIDNTQTCKWNQIKQEFQQNIDQTNLDIQKLYQQSTMAVQEFKNDILKQVELLSVKIDNSISLSSSKDAEKKDKQDLKESELELNSVSSVLEITTEASSKPSTVTTSSSTAAINDINAVATTENDDEDTTEQTLAMEKAFISFLSQQQQQQQPSIMPMQSMQPSSHAMPRFNELLQQPPVYPQSFQQEHYGGSMHYSPSQPFTAAAAGGGNKMYHSYPLSADQARYMYQPVAPLSSSGKGVSAPPPLPSTLLSSGYYQSPIHTTTSAGSGSRSVMSRQQASSARVPTAITRSRRRTVPIGLNRGRLSLPVSRPWSTRIATKRHGIPQSLQQYPQLRRRQQQQQQQQQQHRYLNQFASDQAHLENMRKTSPYLHKPLLSLSRSHSPVPTSGGTRSRGQSPAVTHTSGTSRDRSSSSAGARDRSRSRSVDHHSVPSSSSRGSSSSSLNQPSTPTSVRHYFKDSHPSPSSATRPQSSSATGRGPLSSARQQSSSEHPIYTPSYDSSLQPLSVPIYQQQQTMQHELPPQQQQQQQQYESGQSRNDPLYQTVSDENQHILNENARQEAYLNSSSSAQYTRQTSQPYSTHPATRYSSSTAAGGGGGGGGGGTSSSASYMSGDIRDDLEPLVVSALRNPHWLHSPQQTRTGVTRQDPIVMKTHEYANLNTMSRNISSIADTNIDRGTSAAAAAATAAEMNTNRKTAVAAAVAESSQLPAEIRHALSAFISSRKQRMKDSGQTPSKQSNLPTQTMPLQPPQQQQQQQQARYYPSAEQEQERYQYQPDQQHHMYQQADYVQQQQQQQMHRQPQYEQQQQQQLPPVYYQSPPYDDYQQQQLQQQPPRQVYPSNQPMSSTYYDNNQYYNPLQPQQEEEKQEYEYEYEHDDIDNNVYDEGDSKSIRKQKPAWVPNNNSQPWYWPLSRPINLRHVSIKSQQTRRHRSNHIRHQKSKQLNNKINTGNPDSATVDDDSTTLTTNSHTSSSSTLSSSGPISRQIGSNQYNNKYHKRSTSVKLGAKKIQIKGSGCLLNNLEFSVVKSIM